jgi:hypothetical protein
MTAAEQRELFKQALALPKKARLNLYKRLVKSLEAPDKGEKPIRGSRILAEPGVAYGAVKSRKRRAEASPKAEALSRKEWNEAWMVEIKRRAEEMESGADPGVPLEEVLKFLDEKPKRRA